jgi:GR25 family glycosyltransferase involved in LPS biosynthesis
MLETGGGQNVWKSSYLRGSKCLKLDNIMYDNLNDNIIEKTPYDKAIVINLDSSTERLAKITQQFNQAGVEFERFNAINGYSVVIKNLKTDKSFTGMDLKNKTAEIERFSEYKITCNPGEEKLVELNYYTYKKKITAGELGIWCSAVSVWKYIQANNFNNTIIFEDDVIIKDATKFKNQLYNFITDLPSTYDIAYIDARQHKGKQKPLPNTKLINMFSDDSGTWGFWAAIFSKKAIDTLLPAPCYAEEIDNYLWHSRDADPEIRPKCLESPLSLELYISSIDLIDVHKTGSVICAMGRDSWQC